MPSFSKTLPGRLRRSETIASKNSPIAYGLGFMGLTAVGQAFRGYYLFFYVDVLGLALALAAIVNIVYAIWDSVNDPLVGFLSDNTRAGWGRCHVSGENPGPNLEAAFRFFISAFPFVFMVIAWLLARSLHLESRQSSTTV